jgi:transcription termination factor Rho
MDGNDYRPIQSTGNMEIHMDHAVIRKARLPAVTSVVPAHAAKSCCWNPGVLQKTWLPLGGLFSKWTRSKRWKKLQKHMRDTKNNKKGEFFEGDDPRFR